MRKSALISAFVATWCLIASAGVAQENAEFCPVQVSVEDPERGTPVVTSVSLRTQEGIIVDSQMTGQRGIA